MHGKMLRALGWGLVLGAMVGVLAPTAAMAQRKAPKVVAARTAQAFRAVDLNADRQIDSSEWATAGRPADTLAALDRNNNGTLGYWEALSAILAAFRAKVPGGR